MKISFNLAITDVLFIFPLLTFVWPNQSSLQRWKSSGNSILLPSSIYLKNSNPRCWLEIALQTIIILYMIALYQFTTL